MGIQEIAEYIKTLPRKTRGRQPLKYSYGNFNLEFDIILIYIIAGVAESGRRKGLKIPGFLIMWVQFPSPVP